MWQIYNPHPKQSIVWPTCRYLLREGNHFVNFLVPFFSGPCSSAGAWLLVRNFMAWGFIIPLEKEIAVVLFRSMEGEKLYFSSHWLNGNSPQRSTFSRRMLCLGMKLDWREIILLCIECERNMPRLPPGILRNIPHDRRLTATAFTKRMVPPTVCTGIRL